MRANETVVACGRQCRVGQRFGDSVRANEMLGHSDVLQHVGRGCRMSDGHESFASLHEVRCDKRVTHTRKQEEEEEPRPLSSKTLYANTQTRPQPPTHLFLGQHSLLHALLKALGHVVQLLFEGHSHQFGIIDNRTILRVFLFWQKHKTFMKTTTKQWN